MYDTMWEMYIKQTKREREKREEPACCLQGRGSIQSVLNDLNQALPPH